MTEPLEIKDGGGFLDRDALGLSEEQYCGLVKTLALLESGALDHENEEYGIARFDMRNWNSPMSMQNGNCGTVCCIGGTASHLMGSPNLYNDFTENDESCPYSLFERPNLLRVFYPNKEYFGRRDHPGWRATPQQAAMVLRHYLTTGKGDWDLPFQKSGG